MTGWAIEQLRPMVYAVARGESRHLPVVVELGTGCGAVAKSIATELTGTRVHAVEVSEEAADMPRVTSRIRRWSSTCGTCSAPYLSWMAQSTW